ncbi:MAG: hypothetical protein VXZ96_16640 [Myxococcota bacterium]|nr:hypothetical protein [Myxococcota bacterium]MEC8381961.1 hypothetical protein [Myxococcota bacterium]
MPQSIDSLIQHFLTTGKPSPSIETKSLNVLSIFIAPEVLNAGILPALAKGYVFSASIIPMIEKNAFWMKRHDLGITICSEESDALLRHALEIHNKNQHLPLSFGLSYGNGLVVENGEWISVARMQAERMATLGSHGYITASMPFIESLGELPDGIGAFPLNKSVQSLIGFSCVLIRDFRQPNR